MMKPKSGRGYIRLEIQRRNYEFKENTNDKCDCKIFERYCFDHAHFISSSGYIKLPECVAFYGIIIHSNVSFVRSAFDKIPGFAGKTFKYQRHYYQEIRMLLQCRY